MGKFSDTKYVSTIDNLVDSTKNKLNNPYYIFNDKKPTKVTYFAQDIEKSTLDEASGLYESNMGDGSPFKFNKIKEFVIYGLDRMPTEYDLGDDGIEANPITGEAIILPNTITPRPGDYFHIGYIKEKNLFIVNSVSIDTLDSGANIYKIEYALCAENRSIESIEKQVDQSFNFIINNAGTDFKTVILSTDFDLVKELEELVEYLITSFNNIFFNKQLQTFVYNHDGWNIYDPYMIEFLIRNKVLTFGSEYIYVGHATTTDKTFGMDYNKTFFYALENPEDDIKCVNLAIADLIQDPNSLFMTRLEEYYGIKYNDKTPYKTRFQTVSTDVIDHIKSYELYEKGNIKEYYNLWISYFNNNKDFIRGDIMDIIKHIDYMDNLECFYALGISIFIIEQYIKMLSR